MGEPRPAFLMAHRNNWTAALLTAVLLLALALGACAGGGESPAPADTPTVAATATATETATPLASPAAAPPSPTPTSTPDLRDGGVALIETAYNRMLNEYVSPLEPAQVLVPAWQGIAGELGAQGFAAPRQPSFAGSREEAWAVFREMYVGAVRANPQADAQRLRYAVLQRIANSVNDCHTFFLPPAQAEALVEVQTGKGTVGIGVELGWGPPVFVREAVTGGPAANAGMRAGDRIITIAGENVSQYPLPAVDELLRGDEGTTVAVSFRHAGEGEAHTAELRRELVDPPTVESRMLAGGIGYIRIRAFILGGISGEIDRALASLESAGARAVVVDIRDNPGGYLDVPSISRFVESGIVVRSQGRGAEATTPADGSYRRPPMASALLTNASTASVAEIFAAALQDHGVARVIGAETGGCAGYTKIDPFGDGSSLGITIARNVTPLTGRPLDQGLAPDEAAEKTIADMAEGRDPVIERAIAYLRTVIG